MIRKGIVKEMLEKIERQNDVKIEAIRKKLDIKGEIEKKEDKGVLQQNQSTNDGQIIALGIMIV